MFVRWKKKMRQDGTNYMLTATLVENSRVDGKIQQRHILQLGSISTKKRYHSYYDKGKPAGQTFGTTEYKQARFWMNVLETVYVYAERSGISISTLEKEKICASIALKVPRPTDEDLAAHLKDHLAWVRQYYKPEYVARFEAWFQECGV